jgi:hypothetical protein
VTTPTWIVERDVLAIHDRLLALDGGGFGVRDAGLLASALARPPLVRSVRRWRRGVTVMTHQPRSNEEDP